MRTPDADFITDLEGSAIAAQREEISFRQNIAAEIAKRERARAFAFRRLDLARTMAEAANGADNADEAIARQIAALKRELDWHSDTDARTRVLDAWRPVAEAVWSVVGSDDAAEGAPAPARAAVPQALAAFESWYESEHGKPFLDMFEVVIEEMPVVEF